MRTLSTEEIAKSYGGRQVVREFEDEFGPIPAEVLAEVDRKWPE